MRSEQRKRSSPPRNITVLPSLAPNNSGGSLRAHDFLRTLDLFPVNVSETQPVAPPQQHRGAQEHPPITFSGPSPFLQLGAASADSSTVQLPLVEPQVRMSHLDKRVQAEVARRLRGVLQSKIDQKHVDLMMARRLQRYSAYPPAVPVAKRASSESQQHQRVRKVTITTGSVTEPPASWADPLMPSTAIPPGAPPVPVEAAFPPSGAVLASLARRVEKAIAHGKATEHEGPIELVRVNRLVGQPDHNRGLFAGLEGEYPYSTRSDHFTIGNRGGKRIRPAAWYMWRGKRPSAADASSPAAEAGAGSQPDSARRARSNSTLSMRTRSVDGHTFFEWGTHQIPPEDSPRPPSSTGSRSAHYRLSVYDDQEMQEWLQAVEAVLDARYGKPLTEEDRLEARRRLKAQRQRMSEAQQRGEPIYPHKRPSSVQWGDDAGTGTGTGSFTSPVFGSSSGDRPGSHRGSLCHVPPHAILQHLPPGSRYVEGKGFVDSMGLTIEVTEEQLQQWGLLVDGHDGSPLHPGGRESGTDYGSRTLTAAEAEKIHGPPRDRHSSVATIEDSLLTVTAAEAAPTTSFNASHHLPQRPTTASTTLPIIEVEDASHTLSTKAASMSSKDKKKRRRKKRSKDGKSDCDSSLDTKETTRDSEDAQPPREAPAPAAPSADAVMRNRVREILGDLDIDIDLPIFTNNSPRVPMGGLFERLQPKDPDSGSDKKQPAVVVHGLSVSQDALHAKFRHEAEEEYRELVALRDSLQEEVEAQGLVMDAFKTDIRNLSTCAPGSSRDDYAVRLTREVNAYAKKHRLQLRHLYQNEDAFSKGIGEVAMGFLDHFGKGKVQTRDISSQVCDEDLGYINETVRDAKAQMEELFFHERALMSSIKLATVAIANIMSFHASLELESTCKECFYLFDHPRTLWPCGHTFCQQCLSGMYNRHDQIICGECGSLCEVGYTPNLSIELVSNYQVIQDKDGGDPTGGGSGQAHTIESVLRSLLNGILASQRAARPRDSFVVPVVVEG